MIKSYALMVITIQKVWFASVFLKGVGVLMPLVRVKENEPFEKALKRFTKVCQKEGILFEYRKRQYFEKPSERRKRKANAARKKILKRIRLEKEKGLL